MLAVYVNAETFIKIRRERAEPYCNQNHRRAPAVRAFATEEQQDD